MNNKEQLKALLFKYSLFDVTTVVTQDQIFELMKDIMEVAEENGIVVNCSMPNAKVKKTFKSNASLIVSPYRHGDGKVMLHPMPDAYGIKFDG